MKYIYFEIKYISGYNSTEQRIENENILLNKPHTNSGGVWGFTSITERHGFEGPSFSVVQQNWIDLEKFDREHTVYKGLKNQVDIVLERINLKLRDNKLKRIVNE
jgi:hypothetical protein